MSLELTQVQIAHIKNLKDSGQYEVAYAYIAQISNTAVQNGTVSEETQRWFQFAEHINGNYDSFINNYARNYAKLGAAFNGDILTDADFQMGSNAIANLVLQDVIIKKEIPYSPENIILTDITTGSRLMGIDLEDFPGTMVAASLFDTDTLDQLIVNNPDMGVWEKVLAGTEQVGKHLGMLAYGYTIGGIEGLLNLASDPTRLGDLFDAARDIMADGTFRDILGEIGEDANNFFDGLASDYGWALDNPNVFIPDVLKDHHPTWFLPPSGLHDGGSQTFGQHGCPLVLDLDGDGVEVSKLGYGAAGSSVYFDIDNDGFAERTAWVTGGDGLLVIDKNANGTIDQQSELFGNAAGFADGFAHLQSYDSNQDNMITSADTSWGDLKVWVDANANGISEAAELKTLESLQITQINLAATAQTALFREENAVTATGTFVMNGVSRAIEDVWFQYDSADTQYRGNVTLDVRTLFLPTLKGFGNLPDLRAVC